MKNVLLMMTILIPLSLFAQPDRDDHSRKAMGIWQITERLDLTESQAEKFFPKFKSHRNEMEKIEEDKRESLKLIHESLKDGKDVSEKDLDRAIKDLESFEKKKLQARLDYMNDLDGVLSTKQRAQLLMMPSGMKKEAKEKIKKHKKQRKRRHDRDRW